VGLARCGTVFPVSVVLGAAVPAAGAAGGCARAVLVGRGVSRRYTYHHPPAVRRAPGSLLHDSLATGAGTWMWTGAEPYVFAAAVSIMFLVALVGVSHRRKRESAAARSIATGLV